MRTRVIAVAAIAALITVAGPPASAFGQVNPVGQARDAITGVADTATCRQAPEPEDPASGWAGILGDEPANPTQLPPWQQDAQGNWVRTDVPIQEAYGYVAPLATYDLGCAGQIEESGWDRVAQIVALGGPFWFGLRDRLKEGVLHPETVTGPLRDALSHLAPAVQTGMWQWMLGVSLGILVLVLLVLTIRTEPSRALSLFGWALLLMCVTSFFLAQPTKALDISTGWFQEGVAQVNGGHDPSTFAGDQAYERIWWNTWVVTQFGADEQSSPTAHKYAAPLFQSRVLSYAEKKRDREHPEDGKDMIDGKKQAFADIADHVSKEDPVAYRYLQGANGLQRTQRFFVADFGVLGTVIVRIIASVMALAALIAMAAYIGGFPIPAGLGIVGHRVALLHLTERVVGIVLGAIACSYVANVVEVFIGAFLSVTGQGPWLILLAILLTVGMAWWLTRRHRNLTDGKIMRAVARGTKLGLTYLGIRELKEAMQSRRSGNASSTNKSATRRQRGRHPKAGDSQRPSTPRGESYGEKLRAKRPKPPKEPVPVVVVGAWEPSPGRRPSQVPARRAAKDNQRRSPAMPPTDARSYTRSPVARTRTSSNGSTPARRTATAGKDARSASNGDSPRAGRNGSTRPRPPGAAGPSDPKTR